DLAGLGHRHVFGVARGELGAHEFHEVRRLGGVDQVPVQVAAQTPHELVADPHGRARGAAAAARVVASLTQAGELVEVQVPVLHVEAQGAELLAATGNGAQRRVDGVHERDGPGGGGVVRLDGRTL